MRRIRGVRLYSTVAAAIAVALVAGVTDHRTASTPQSLANQPPTVTATNSSTIALTPDDRFVWVVNPDNNSVSVLEVGGDVNLKRAEIPVGAEPWCVAITPDGAKVYVTNTVGGSVSVIDAAARQIIKTIPSVGVEPFGCALTPAGDKLYVANSSSGSVSVIDTATDEIIARIKDVGYLPRGIAITSNPSGQTKVYVTQFLAQLRDDERPVVQKEGRDDGKEGRVTVISGLTDQIVGTVVLNPASTGFLSDGSTLDRLPLKNSNNTPAGDPNNRPTTAFPNLLQGIVIKGDRAYLPNTASSPNGPFKFNVNVQGFLSVIDIITDQEATGQTINMNRGIQFEPPGQRLFITNPLAFAFKRGVNEGFVVSAATNRLVRVLLDAQGKPTINAPTGPLPAGTLSDVIRVEVGTNPRGIVINSTDTRAYVMNFLSRDVSVVDISGSAPSQLTRIASASLPAPGTLAATVLRGHELFNTSIGPAGTQANSTPPAGRMSDFGWGTCYSCHPSGLTDGVTWMFGDGPRQAISMESTFAHPQPPGALLNANNAPLLPSSHQRVLNWSAVRDEVQDFELNIRAVSGGQGLITDGQAVVNLQPTANTGRSADLDSIAAYIAFGIRAPISPIQNEGIQRGRRLFAEASCDSCHGGVNWTRSRVDFTPPPATGEPITGGQLTRFLANVGTFDPNDFTDGLGNEIRANQTANVIANGALGFNIPSLLSVFAGAPYLHNGAAPTLDDVLENVTHRSAGNNGVDRLSKASDRRHLVKFLISIDASTEPFE